MSKAEIMAALRIGEDTPLWRAFHQMLSAQIADAVSEATDPDNHLHAPLPAYYSGAARELQRFQDWLREQRQVAMETPEEDE